MGADIACRAVTFARDRNLEREAVVEERVMLRDALQRSLGEARMDAIKQEFDRRVEQGEFVAVEQKPGTPGRSFTTPAMLSSSARRSNKCAPVRANMRSW